MTPGVADACEHRAVAYDEVPYENPHVTDWVATIHHFTCVVCGAQAGLVRRVHLDPV